MTDAEIATERAHLIETRIAILCGTREPTREQRNIAQREADAWEDTFRLKAWQSRDLTNPVESPNVQA